MHKAMSRLKVSPPHGMIITLAFREHGVKLEGETSRALMHIDTYNDHSLHRMGYNNVDSHWVRSVGR